MGTQTHGFTPMGTDAYLAPELYDVAAKREKGQNPRANLFKTDIYSTALVILYCSGISEMEISKGINCFNKKKHQDDIETYIDENIKSSYPGLDLLVRKMSAFNPDERVDVVEALRILERLYPGPNPINKPVII